MSRRSGLPARRHAASKGRGREDHGFRGDIEGLRAVAVVLVVAYHAGVLELSGGYVGVDVFFVISGFLITGLLVDELRRTGTVSLRSFYARRVRRLLPLATVVLIATTVASTVVLSPLDHGGVAHDVRAAALFVSNWSFAADATQYSQTTEQSPVLHYWSLSVEEQYYVLWPLILVLAAGHTRGRRGRPSLRRVAVLLAALGVASFAASVTLTADTGAWAYFGLHTRAWELAVGAGLALARPVLATAPQAPAHLAGWTGLLLVGWSAVAFDRDTEFPGVAAALPVAGAALVLVAGTGGRGGAAGVLASAPLRFLGRVSYGWYLWHWPVLALARSRLTDAAGTTDDIEAAGLPELPPGVAAACVAGSLGLAVVSHYLIEHPVRSSVVLARARAVTLTAGAVLVSSTVVATAVVLVEDGTSTYAEAGGAASSLLDLSAALDAEPERARAGPTATPIAKPLRVTRMRPGQARRDFAVLSPPCAHAALYPSPAQDCEFGDPAGVRTVALVGDSHARQWLPALQRVAKARQWKLRLYWQGGCPIIDVAILPPRTDAACRQWRGRVLARLQTLRPAAVVVARYAEYVEQVRRTSGARSDAGTVGDVWRPAATRTLKALASFSQLTIMLRDTPYVGFDVPACLARRGATPDRCAFRAAGHVHTDEPLYRAELAASAAVPRTSLVWIDATPVLCPRDRCPVVTTDGVIIYADKHHLTGTLAAAMSGWLEQRIAPAVQRTSAARTPTPGARDDRP